MWVVVTQINFFIRASFSAHFWIKSMLLFTPVHPSVHHQLLQNNLLHFYLHPQHIQRGTCSQFPLSKTYYWRELWSCKYSWNQFYAMCIPKQSKIFQFHKISQKLHPFHNNILDTILPAENMQIFLFWGHFLKEN